MMQPAMQTMGQPGEQSTVGVGKTGSVRYFGQRGFGNIAPDDGSEDVFFHLQAVINGVESDLVPGARLKYDLAIDNMSGRTKGVNIVLDAPGAVQSMPATPVEVEQFILENPGIEEHAQAKFRALDPISQRTVINRGSLAGARSPTASLLGRITKVNIAAGGTGGMGSMGGMAGGMGGGMSGGMGGGMCGGMGGGMCGGMAGMGGMGGVGGMGGMVSPMTGAVQSGPRVTAMENVIEAGKTGSLKVFGQKGFGYITRDDGAEDVFFFSEHVQNGSVADLVPGARLKFDMANDFKTGRPRGVNIVLEAPGVGQNTAPATPEEVEQFLLENPGIEDHAQMKFRALDPAAQRTVMNAGTVANARSPTAALMSRLRQFKFGGNGYGPVTAPQMNAAGPYGACGGMGMVNPMANQMVNVTAAGQTGSVRDFGQRGFGNITPDDGSEAVFFHVQAVSNGVESDLVPGARLRYDLAIDNRSGRTKGINIVLDTPGAGQIMPTVMPG